MEKGYRILLAEDEAKLSQVIQEELNNHGFKTDVAFDGQIAEKLFNQHQSSL